MSAPTYQSEPWFALLKQRCEGRHRSEVAKLLGVSSPTLSQVLNASGKYGSGQASTAAVALRVIHTFGNYACPHLSAEAGGTPKHISADQCRQWAHRPAPTGSPRDVQHWQSCQTCPHKAASAPPVARPLVPRTKQEATP